MKRSFTLAYVAFLNCLLPKFDNKSLVRIMPLEQRILIFFHVAIGKAFIKRSFNKKVLEVMCRLFPVRKPASSVAYRRHYILFKFHRIHRLHMRFHWGGEV